MRRNVRFAGRPWPRRKPTCRTMQYGLLFQSSEGSLLAAGLCPISWIGLIEQATSA